MTAKISLRLPGIALFLCAVLLAACANLPWAGEFVIKDSGAQGHHAIRLYWLNDDEVLFGGPTGETKLRKDGVAELIFRVSVWNVRTNQVRRYGELSGSLCHHDGYVAFWEHDIPGNRLWINYGELGKTVRLERGPTQGAFDPVTCRLMTELPPLPEWTKGLVIRRLRPEHGLLVLGSAAPSEAMKNTPISYCPEAKKERCIELPIKQRESRGFDWVPFRGAYFVAGDYFQVDSAHPRGGFNRSPWPKGMLMPVWWLYPNGTVERISLPAGHWLQTLIAPTANGFAAFNTYFTTGEAGVYLVRSGDVRQLIAGLVHQHAVSPTGCRLAINHDPKPLETNARINRHMTLKIIELCQGR